MNVINTQVEFHLTLKQFDVWKQSRVVTQEGKMRGTYIYFYSPVHAQKQGVEIDIANWGLIHPLKVFTLDFQTQPHLAHVSNVWQEARDEV